MLLGLSGERSNQALNLTGVMSDASAKIGVEQEEILLQIAEAVYNGNREELAAIRQEAIREIGAQALVDAIAVAAGFNGITKIANATGLPLDDTTENNTVEMRKETNIDYYTDSNKSQTYLQGTSD